MPKRRFSETHSTDRGSDGNQNTRNTSEQRSANFLLRYTDRPSRRPPSFSPIREDRRQANNVSEATNTSRPFYVGPAHEIGPSHSEQSQTFDVTREYATRQPRRPPLPPYRGDGQQGSEVFQEAGPSRAPERPEAFYVGPAKNKQPYRSPEHLQMEGGRLASQNIQETGLLPPELHPENLPRRSPRLQSLSLHRESNPSGGSDETNLFRPIFVRPANRQSERFLSPLQRKGDDQSEGSVSPEPDTSRPFYVGPTYDTRASRRSSSPLHRGDDQSERSVSPEPDTSRPIYVGPAYNTRSSSLLQRKGDEQPEGSVSPETDPFRPIYIGPAYKTGPSHRSYLLPPSRRDDSRLESKASPEKDLSRPFYVGPAYEISSSFQETGPLSIKSYRTTLDQLTHQASDQGKQVEVVGNDNLFSTFHHRQGANDFKDVGTCFAASAEMLLHQHSIKVNIGGEIRYPTENDLIRYSYHRLGYRPGSGMVLEKVRILLNHFGIPNMWDAGCTEQNLAQLIKDKKSCLIFVRSKDWYMSNANIAPNIGHVISVNAVVYNLSQRSRSTAIAGFIVCDTDDDGGGKRFVGTERLQRVWNGYGGSVIFSIEPYSNGGWVIEPGKGL